MFFLFTFYLKFSFRYEKYSVTICLWKQGSYKRGQIGTNDNNIAIHTSTQCRRLQGNGKLWSVRDCVMCLMPAEPLVLRTNWSPKEIIIQPFLQVYQVTALFEALCDGLYLYFLRSLWQHEERAVIPVYKWAKEVCIWYHTLLHNDGVRKCWFNFKLRAPDCAT